MELEAEVREFLIECNEYMEVLDRDILALEDSPNDAELIANVFRAVHTIKGTCGFFGFDLLGALTHVTETILGQVRDRERPLTPQLVSLLLESLDAMRILLGTIENTGAEGADITAELRVRLNEAAHTNSGVQEEANGQAVREAPLVTALPVSPLSSGPQASSSPQLAAPAPAPVPHTVPEPASASVASPATPSVPPATAARLPAAFPILPATSFAQPAQATMATEPRDEDLPGPAARDVGKEGQLADSTIRVDVGLLNRLMNLVGELVLARNQLLQDTTSQNASLQQTSQRLNLITSELQEGLMKTRMQPIGVVWNKLPRVVRDLAAQCGKLVRIEMEGAGTELDKTIIEAIKDPLTHIVRNSCDHGIESPDERQRKGKHREGLLLLRAYHEGGVVNIEITDDGAGINPERVKQKAIEKGLIRSEQGVLMSDSEAVELIFLPGFSTAAQISTVSGRGVGMDVVKTNIEKIGGNVELLNRAGAGTTVRIKIPLTLAIIPGLVVALHRKQNQSSQWRHDPSGQERFIIPQANLLELVRVEAAEIKRRVENVHGTPIFHHRGQLLPLVYLRKVLGLTRLAGPDDAMNIVVLQAESKQFGLVVDGISDTQEIVVKPLGRQLKGLTCYVGATIMGDGRPALILDVSGLARLARLSAQNRPTLQAATALQPAVHRAEPQMVLLFRAGPYERVGVPLALVDRLEEMRLSTVEHSAGRPVLHYRGEILPLLSLDASALYTPPDQIGDPVLQVVVFTNGRQRAGLVVDQILDIVNEPVTCRQQASAPGVLGSAVIGGKITDLLDLSSLLGSLGQDWFGSQIAAASSQTNTLVLVDSATFSREVLREQLMMSGYDVVSAANASDALVRAREQHSIAAILLNPHGPETHRQDLASAISPDDVLARVPVAEMVDTPSQYNGAGPLQLPRANLSALLHGLPELIAGTAGRSAAWH